MNVKLEDFLEYYFDRCYNFYVKNIEVIDDIILVNKKLFKDNNIYLIENYIYN